jgi:hypothetical protein
LFPAGRDQLLFGRGVMFVRVTTKSVWEFTTMRAKVSLIATGLIVGSSLTVFGQQTSSNSTLLKSLGYVLQADKLAKSQAAAVDGAKAAGFSLLLTARPLKTLGDVDAPW